MEGSKYTSKYLDAPARAAYDRVGLWWSAGARRAAVRVRDHGRGLGVKHEEARADAQRGGQNKGIMLVFYTFSTRYTRYPVYPGTRACGSQQLWGFIPRSKIQDVPRTQKYLVPGTWTRVVWSTERSLCPRFPL